MRKKLMFLAVLFYSLFSFSNPITKEEAIKTATSWLATSYKKSAQKSIKNVQEIKGKGNKTLLYIIEYTNGGFIIISGDNNVRPVLGFSDNGFLPSDTENPLFKDLIATYSSHVLNCINNPTVNKKNVSNWNVITTREGYRVRQEVAPLTAHIKFNQSNGFNKACPVDAAGPGGNALVGCVATAMSQIMSYYEFPTYATGNNSYTHSKYGTIAVNYSEASYNWNTMSKTVADSENQKLSHHAGVAVNMEYSPTSSGAITRAVPNALRNYFKFDPSVKLIYKALYNDADWSTTLKTELSENRPILYSGRSIITTTAGHLFILDGYKTTDQGDYFHLNWGWGGNSNGYFYLNNLTTHNGNHNWVEGNTAIINLKPLNIAPVFTSTNTITTIQEGNNFEYGISIFDENRKDIPQVTMLEGPSWLTVQNLNNTIKLAGIASTSPLNNFTVKLQVTDGLLTNIQEFTFSVTPKPVVVNTIIDFETNDFSQATFLMNAKPWVIVPTVKGFSAKAALIKDNEISKTSITKNFTKTSIVSFDVKVSSEKTYDNLAFYVDGVKVKQWSGIVVWETFSHNISAGNHTLSWEYVKDSSVKNGEDTAWLDNINLDKVQAPVTTNIIDFETNNFTQGQFLTDWSTVSKDNSIVAASNTITHNQVSTMQLTTNYNLPSVVSFDLKVSSEKNYDLLTVKLDNVVQNKWSGEQDWTKVSVQVPAGNHVITWEYKKDNSVSGGLDKAWVDNVSNTSVATSKNYVTNSVEEITNISKTTIYPNPVTSQKQANLSLFSNENKVITLVIFANNGQIVSTREIQINKGDNTVALDTMTLTPGVYFVKSFGLKEDVSLKLVVN